MTQDSSIISHPPFSGWKLRRLRSRQCFQLLECQAANDLRRTVPRLIVWPEPAYNALHINQDGRIYASLLEAGRCAAQQIAAGHGARMKVVDGEIDVNGETLHSGDSIAIERTDPVLIAAA